MDREEASREYERARQKLIRYFEWRSVLGAEDWADETMNRAARRIDEGQKIDKLMSYLYGVARHIYKEILRDPNQNAANVDDLDRNLPDNKPVFVDPDARQLCFDKCLAGLSTDNQDLILEYFQGEGGVKIRGRQSIADRLEIPLNALRIRVHRIRKSLENCIADCLRQNLVRND